MKFIISGKNIEVTPGLKDAIEQKLGKLERYFTPETEIIVTLSVEKERQKIENKEKLHNMLKRAVEDQRVYTEKMREESEREMMKMKDAGLPKMVLDQTPKAFRGRKMPIVKAKIGPRVMSLMCDPKVFDQIPIKAEVKAEVSGIYIVGIKSVRGGKIVVPEKKKKGFFKKNK